MPTYTPSPFGPGRLIRWGLSPLWLLLAVGQTYLWSRSPSTGKAALAILYAVLCVFWTWISVREYRILKSRREDA